MAATARRVDPFLLLILAAVGLAVVLPATGRGTDALAVATTAAVFALFFGYGAKLPFAEAVAGLRHWRLHLVILGCTFVVFPLLGLGLQALPGGWVSPAVLTGIVYCCLVPSTVQSSITFTSIAGGNVAGAMVSATMSNLLGVLLTPLLVLAVLGRSGGGIGLGQVGTVALQLLLPFVLGQLSRRWTAGFVERHSVRIRWLDQGVICLVVYGAFSHFVASGTWRQVGVADLAVVIAVCLALLAFMLWLTWALGGWLGFSRADRIAICFCGTKKSLATGVPMASVLFAGGTLGLVVLPLMVFHQAQLMACSALAPRLRAAGTPSVD